MQRTYWTVSDSAMQYDSEVYASEREARSHARKQSASHNSGVQISHNGKSYHYRNGVQLKGTVGSRA